MGTKPSELGKYPSQRLQIPKVYLEHHLTQEDFYDYTTMGGGVSLIEGVEDLVTTTIIIGKAISAMTFPGMFRIYDFHSIQAPKLKNAKTFSFFAPDSDEEDEDEDANPPDPSQYEHFFRVTVNNDDIYIEEPLAANESGWTPLHTCCMSLSTVKAGLDLIAETVRLGGDFETKTIYGPGTFNRGWTPLQMACAYGVAPLVEKLVEHGANVNATNCYGISCLLEACHRGFLEIVQFLLRAHPDLSYIPSEEDVARSPFGSAPCQSALGEAARCGYFKIVKVLLDAGVQKDLANEMGWTALHEACFYHRIETVKTLLLAGCDPTLRTKRGALPYHLAGLSEIRNMLESMGGPDAVPKEGDVIDMLQVLTDLTMPEQFADQSETISGRQEQSRPLIMVTGGSQDMPVMVFEPQQSAPKSHHTHSKHDAKHAKSTDDEEPPLLHSGGVLGDLPNLSPQKPSPSKQLHRDADAALSPSASHFSSNSLSRKADEKKKKKKKNRADDVPKDIPKEFLCQLTQKPMSEPVKTVYGNIYDKTAILNWFSTQGRICPLTGAPLAESDLTPMEELGNQIRQWILKKSLQSSSVDEKAETAHESPVKTQTSPENDDLYDF